MKGLQQIATYNNRVVEIVPDYRLKETSDGTITITKDSVEQATYAPFSENDQTEGMYIQSYSINEEGRSEKEWYEQDLLVAIVDLNYRFLSPINSNTPDKPNTPSPKNIISNDGCVEINNNQQTIVRGESYIATLSTKQGFSRIPNGHIEMQTGNDTWETKQSWTNKATVAISVDNVIGNLRFVFDEECVYNLTIRRTLNGQSWPECPIGEIEIIPKYCSDSIDTDSEEIKKPITNYLINSVTPSGQITPCTNTEITVDYKPANSPLVLTWYDTTEEIALHTNDSLSVPSGEVWDEEALNVERQKITIDPKVYEYDNMSPTSVAGDGSPKAVVFNYHKIPYTVTYNVGEHVHMPDSSTQSTYYNGEVSERTYTIDEGFTLSSSYTEEAATVVIENGRINVTNIVKNVTINLSAASTVESIFASNMDAMGGVRLYAKYTDGTTEIINPAEATLNSYTVGSTTTNVSEQENVEVYDYNFIDNNNYTGEDKITTATKEIIRKKRVPLENPTTSDVPNISLNVTYKGFNQDISGITQRAEVYGYYEGGLKSNSNSSVLKTVDATTTNWKTGYLVDFGDSYNMYGDDGPTEQNPDKVKIGLDIYNKDITPYYIPGTDIGENPLDHLDSEAKFVYSGSTKPIINYNKPRVNNEEHNHILWHDFHTSNSSIKGRIFTNDYLSSKTSGCGNYDSDCGCSKHESLSNLIKFYTLEARAYTNPTNTILIDTNVNYEYYYDIPLHKYGKDSISYYHCNNEKYSSKIKDEVFKDDENTIINFSYPVHIYTNVSNNNNYETKYSKIPNESYKFETLRWESSPNDNIKTPDDSNYNYYGNDCYYDYNNKVKTGLTTFFDPYSDDYYFEDEDKGKELNQLIIESNEPNDTGRLVTEYYTLMSPQKQVRPIITEIENPTEEPIKEYKFIKLDGTYNGADYLYDKNSSKIILKDLSEYIRNKDNHTTYISSNFEDSELIAKEPKTLGRNDYLYSIEGVNTDYSQQYSNNAYSDLSERIAQETSNNYYPYRWYNLDTGVQFGQYCNSDSNSSHYLRNNDYAKYVACAEGFKDVNYNVYYPDTYSNNHDIFDWWINNLPNITNITNIGYEGGRYKYNVNVINRETGETVTYKCNNTSANNSVYGDNLESFYELTYKTVPIYTNADSITVEFLGGCPDENETDTCGIGSFKIEVNSTEDQSEPWTSANSTKTKELSGDSTIRIIANTKTPELIELLPNSMSSEARRSWLLGSTPMIDPETGEQAIDPETGEGIVTPNILTYRENMFTGGGRFKITANWTNGDERILIIDISGTCNHNSNNNPNKEGCMISWLDLVKYYKLSSSSNTRYDNANADSNVILEWIGPE